MSSDSHSLDPEGSNTSFLVSGQSNNRMHNEAIRRGEQVSIPFQRIIYLFPGKRLLADKEVVIYLLPVHNKQNYQVGHHFQELHG